MESPHRASWRETVTGVKDSSECRQRRRNREKERDGSAKGGWSDEIERRDRNGSVRSDKQSLGRIPLGTKLYSPPSRRVNPVLSVLYTVVPCAFLALSQARRARLPLFLSFHPPPPHFHFSFFQMNNTDSPPAKTTSRCIAPRQSS